MKMPSGSALARAARHSSYIDDPSVGIDAMDAVQRGHVGGQAATVLRGIAVTASQP